MTIKIKKIEAKEILEQNKRVLELYLRQLEV